MFYIKYLTMHKVHMHAGVKRQLLYGCAYIREIIHSLSSWIILPYTRTNQLITYTCSPQNAKIKDNNSCLVQKFRSVKLSDVKIYQTKYLVYSFTEI